MENLHGIVYISKALVPFDSAQLEELSMRSLIANQERGITGFLYYEKEYFLQYLEGPPDRVQVLMERIKKDARHTVKRIKEKADLPSPKFPDWHMHRLEKSSLIEVRMEKLILENMLMMHKDFILLSKRANDSIWSMIDRVSRLQSALV